MNPGLLNSSNIFYKLSDIPDFRRIVRGDENVENNYVLINNDKNYKIVRYNKNYLSGDLVSTYGLLRSVIVNKDNHVVSFAPPKSVSSHTFIEKNNEITNKIVAEEFVEGTMINVFWDPCIGLGGSWEIATRNKVGAETNFYKNFNDKRSDTNENSTDEIKMQTFRSMFMEACQQTGVEFEMLNRNLCYSFVLQHPCNRIVVPFFKPQLYLVQVCEITNTEDGSVNVFVHDMINLRLWKGWSSTTIRFPTLYTGWYSYTELIDKYASMNTSYDIVGVVIRNLETGERCKIRNPVYEQVRHLRGNQPKLQYQYLFLRQQGRVGDFLKFYPENKKEFSNFRDQVHLFTNTLYQNYISCYIKKEKPLIEFPQPYRNHMFAIHQDYINNLKEKNLYVNNSVVIKYVNDLHPSKLMFFLNFNMRKRKVDFIKADQDDVVNSI
jgi:hypothetical protein